MRRLWKAIIWDLRLQGKYQIVTVALVITVMYTLVFTLLVPGEMAHVLTILIFSDPAMLGFIFIGVLVLFEKDSKTLDAVLVSPLNPSEYLLSKVISLGLIAAAGSLAIAIAGRGWDLQYGRFLFAVFFTSFIFTLIGFACVCRVKSFNQYIILTPLVLAPAILPLLNFLGLTDAWILYLIPTQASLDLILSSLTGEEAKAPWFALMYLPAWFLLTYWIAYRSFQRFLITSHQS